MALTADDREAIEALVEGYATHALVGDWHAYADLFHTDAVRMYPGPQVYEGRREIFNHAEGFDPTFHHFDVSTIEVSGNRELAYIWVRSQVEFSSYEEGEVVTRQDDSTWLSVVRPDENGAWRFFRHIVQTNDHRVVDSES